VLFDNFDSINEFINDNKYSEERNCEFKSSNPWSNDFRMTITKAILCMANKKNGGSIIIGVDENKDKGIFTINGSDEQMTNQYSGDEIRKFVNEKYADPSVSLTVQKIKIVNSEKYLINIHVSEFDNIPITCKKEYKDILKKDSLYSRSFKKPECSSSLTSEELREIIDMAKDKAVKKEIEHLKEIGVIPSLNQVDKAVKKEIEHLKEIGVPSLNQVDSVNILDNEKFANERNGF